jgi:hypothetical protein
VRVPARGLERASRVTMHILRHAQIDVTVNLCTGVLDAKTLQALKRLAKQLDT